jgi:hypothetical protein
MSRKLMRIRTVIGLASMTLVVTAAASCGDVIRSSRSPVLLVVNSISGGTEGESFLLSDVIVNRITPAPCTAASPCPTVFNDPGSAALSVIMKDATVSPTANNSVTVTSYHVAYSRADGHNIPGVDVPFSFDGVVTSTVAAGGTGSVGFELVRHSAKSESPLVQLSRNPGAHLSVIATINFFGTDRVGTDMSATGSILIDFADFGDK